MAATHLRDLLFNALKEIDNELKNTEKEEEKKFQEKLEKLFNSEKFIGNVCLSYDHSFGIMEETKKRYLIFQCKEWMRAINNNLNCLNKNT
jgi:hypothetical protein